MPRTKREPVVVPTTSLVASAVRYDGKSARIYQPLQDWQKEAYRHFAICGEARFAATFFGHALSRASLLVGTKGPLGYVPSEETPAKQVLDDLFNGKDGQAQMLSSIGIHLTVAGECYLVGRSTHIVDQLGNDTEDDVTEDVWEVVSVLEMKVTGVGKNQKWKISTGGGYPDVELGDSDVVIRIWTPSPARRVEADSPFRSLLPVLAEIEWLTRHIFAQVSSRLAGAGILFLPQGITFPPPPNVNAEQAALNNEATNAMLMLAEAMLAPMKDAGNPAGTVPIVMMVPDEVYEKIDQGKLLHFWSNLDEKALEMRNDAIHRFALGMDVPPEQVLGMSSNSGTGGGTSNGVSHWGAWQIEEATIKMHVEPMLDTVVNAITIGYVRPLVETDEVVYHDTSALRLKPDRSKEALELFDRGVFSVEALLREIGFDITDLPKADEFENWLLRKIASGSATPEQVQAAAKALGVDLGVQVDPVEPVTAPREARPAPSLEDHPTEERTPPPPSALLHASEALVFRALERAGNRIRQAENVKPPGVPAHQMHTLFRVNGTADKFLDDAWSCATQVLDGLADVDLTVRTLDAYCRSLFAEQAPHSRDRLEKWLEASA